MIDPLRTNNNAVMRHCKGCVYRVTMMDGCFICDYYLKTKKRRPCPAGEGCTVRLDKPKKRRLW